MQIFSLFLFMVQDLVPRSWLADAGLDFQKFTHLLCKSSNFQQSYKFPDKSSQIVISVGFGNSNYEKNPHPAVVTACN